MLIFVVAKNSHMSPSHYSAGQGTNTTRIPIWYSFTFAIRSTSTTKTSTEAVCSSSCSTNNLRDTINVFVGSSFSIQIQKDIYTGQKSIRQ
mmetsp:Transcript_22853/g.54144  ORF Transcript_22853/g.54144 Transcript_22853/m.54144 type:complete len:91 (-) Transcript_22853:2193-2465(-)